MTTTTDNEAPDVDAAHVRAANARDQLRLRREELEAERDALRSLLAAAARGELPRCDCWHGCSRIAAQEATEGETAWSCDECLAKHERAADRRARAGWRDLPHAAALRAAMGGGA